MSLKVYVNIHFGVFSWPLSHNGNIDRKHVQLVLWCTIKMCKREKKSPDFIVGLNKLILMPCRHFADCKSAVEMFIISLLEELFYYEMIPFWIENISGRVCESLRCGRSYNHFVSQFTTYNGYCHHSQVVNLTANWSIKLH